MCLFVWENKAYLHNEHSQIRCCICESKLLMRDEVYLISIHSWAPGARFSFSNWLITLEMPIVMRKQTPGVAPDLTSGSHRDTHKHLHHLSALQLTPSGYMSWFSPQSQTKIWFNIIYSTLVWKTRCSVHVHFFSIQYIWIDLQMYADEAVVHVSGKNLGCCCR